MALGLRLMNCHQLIGNEIDQNEYRSEPLAALKRPIEPTPCERHSSDPMGASMRTPRVITIQSRTYKRKRYP